jgi:hypothetical protein
VNPNGARQNILQVVRNLLWNALERSHGVRSAVDAKNEFVIDPGTLDKLGSRPVIFNSQINRIDIRMHQDIYAAIKKLDELEFGLVKADVSIDSFIEHAFNSGVELPELLARVERMYVLKAHELSKKKKDAAARIGLKRTTYHSKLLKYQK